VRAHFQTGLAFGLLILGCCVARTRPQEPASPALIESGQVVLNGRSTPYLIRRLPVNAFPALPAAVQNELTRRGCLIPQTYEAHGPENVVHASLERSDSSDWAVLCSVRGTVSLLVFFADGGGTLTELASAPETGRLQAHGSSPALGFNWAIDPASPDAVHQAQLRMKHPSARLDHDALADSVIDRKKIFHFHARNAWSLVGTQD
jgi:hypothetical protein